MTTERQDHRRFLELAASAIDGPLAPSERAELESHLSGCSACARRAAALRADAALLAQPFLLVPSDRIDAAVYAAIARPTTQSPRYVFIAAAALLILALFAAAAVGAYLRRSFEDPISVRPSEPPVAPVSPGPSTPAALVGESWEAMKFDDGGTGGWMVAATLSGSDLVGVGRGGCVPDFNNPTNCYGAAWTASPGEPWVRAPDQPGLEMGLGVSSSGPLKLISDVVAGPAGLVAIGYDIGPPRLSCEVAPCTSGPAVWRSQDGRTWERARIDLGPGIIDRFSDPVAAITADADGYVMVGFASGLDRSGAIDARAAAWASPDGLTWTRANDSEDLFLGACIDTGETPACPGMLAVTATPTGFVAVGHAYNGNDGQSRPSAWTSPDGSDWTLAVNGLDFHGRLSGVTAGGPGLVAVGTICEPSCVGVAATSVDGSVWSFAPIEGATGLEDVGSAGGPVFALGGLDPAPDRRAELELWRTDDGVAWRRVSSFPALPDVSQYQAIDIVVAPDRAVVIAGVSLAGANDWSTLAYSSPPLGAPAEPSASSAAAPSPEPTPRCPSPSQAVQEPTVWAAVNGEAKVATTPGSFTVATCTTTRTDDRPAPEPTTPLSARPGQSIELSVPPGWRFLSWQGSDSGVDQEGANVWPATSLPGEPSTVRLPVPDRNGLSQVLLELTLSGEDGHAIAHLGVAFLVQVGEAEAVIRLRPAPTNLGCDSLPASYGYATIRIDASATDQVWAEAHEPNEFWSRGDDTRLVVYWSGSFRGGTADDPVVRDAQGDVVARDNQRVDAEDLARRGIFVCSSQDGIYLLDYQPG